MSVLFYITVAVRNLVHQAPQHRRLRTCFFKPVRASLYWPEPALDVQVSKSKRTGPLRKAKGGNKLHWRLAFDADALQILTNRPVTDLLS